MPNILLTISMITREALRVLENVLVLAKYVRRDFDDKFAVEGAKIGSTLNIRKPPRYTVRIGQALAIQNATETQVPLSLDTQSGVDIEFSSQDLALSIDDFSERFIYPAIAAVANDIDARGLLLYRDIYNAIGTPGVVPASMLLYLQNKQRLGEEAVPMDGLLSMVVTPGMEAVIVNALSGLFQESTKIAEQYAKGTMGRALGFKFSMDQNIATHTSGVFTTGSTPLTNGANQTGNSLITDGWAASTAIFSRGDVFTLGINAVNPQSRADTGALRQFVVTDDVTSSGAGAATIPIEPAMTLTGPFQTVAALAADGVALTMLGAESTASPQGLGFHKDAFVFASADLPLPGGVDKAARVSDKQLGMSLRMIRAYDINSDNWPCRLDILSGWATLYPELACRMVS